MAGVLQKLIRKSSSLRTITTLHNTPFKIDVPLIFNQTHVGDFKPDEEPRFVNPILGCLGNVKSGVSPSLQIYPSFPFGYCLNPVLESGVSEMEQVEDEEVVEDTKTVWADSVKKKRKKKMNKHKYRKLKKRLRRQT